MKHDEKHPGRSTPRDDVALRRQEWLANIACDRRGRRRLRRIVASAAAIRLITKKH